MSKLTKFKLSALISDKLSTSSKQILDERLNNYFKNPSDVTDWDSFMKEVKNTFKY